MTQTTIAALQFAVEETPEANWAKAESLAEEAAAKGARIVLIPELFEGLYFCKDQDPAHFARAKPFAGHPGLARFSALAKRLGLVIPVSFFEHAGQAYFNSLAVIDADGVILGLYRKSHIPDGPGYQEKYYFNPGDTGFRVWETAYGRIGCGICWDQWFPEGARLMALQGADLLLYPTAIGSEPLSPGYDSSAHWRRAMQGHAAANMIPLAAANRIGREIGQSCTLDFYGRSFIADETGALVADAGDTEGIILGSFDFAALRRQRAAWGLFRDRRPELYGALAGLDGHRSPMLR